MSHQGADVGIVGFGFSGLATLMNLIRAAPGASLLVVADDERGHGLAYETTDVAHLLNVQSNRMGAWAGEPADFARWLLTDGAEAACRELGVALPGPLDFAPRALYARYLDDLRAGCLREAEANGTEVRFVDARVTGLVRHAGGWIVRTDSGEWPVRAGVLATGHERRPVFGELSHPHLHDGPSRLNGETIASGGDPIVLIGSGLTAIDSVLTLRRLGFDGEIVALSRNGRLPSAHKRGVTALELTPDDLAELASLDAIVEFIHGAGASGHDWRSAFDALRPHTAALWQRLTPGERHEAVATWMSTWGVLRHRMPPEVAARIDRERGHGGLRVVATTSIRPTVSNGRVHLSFKTPDGSAEQLRCAAVVDCTGIRLDVRQSRDPFLRSLIDSGICTAHDTGLGFAADRHLQAAPDLYLLGSLLIGELWESIAVPELRQQAGLIAARLATTLERPQAPATVARARTSARGAVA